MRRLKIEVSFRQSLGIPIFKSLKMSKTEENDARYQKAGYGPGWVALIALRKLYYAMMETRLGKGLKTVFILENRRINV